ncbi:MAG: HAMP domain-containing protein [Anaerolineales bacterium]|nr:HAMP domain-containing protein [Anaerolineales bacterium]
MSERVQKVREGDFRVSIATKLILSFLLIIVVISLVFIMVGIRLTSDRIVEEAQEKVRNDLNTAREIYSTTLYGIEDVVRFTANRFFLKDALVMGYSASIAEELENVRIREGLDILSLTDAEGNVILRSNNLDFSEEYEIENELVQNVLMRKNHESATTIISDEELDRESSQLAEQASFTLIDTPLAIERDETEITDGMMLASAAPVFDYQNKLAGVLYGGILLNRNYEIVDKIKQTVYEDLKYEGKDIGTATIFQDDVRIATNVRNSDGSRAIGTRVSEEVYNQVVIEGEPWIGRAYVVNDWYITAYEPIENISRDIIGILYVGMLEEKYTDLQRETVLTFLGITLLGSIAAMALAYLLARRISVPIQELAAATKEIEQGNLDAEVNIKSRDELGELAETFNAMRGALKERDRQIREYAQRKVMESERLALIGQIAANVAHELNNPLQGIVTYSHLLLEKMSDESSATDSLNKIVIQANRCRDIIRGLLDFSRQIKPDKTLCNINSVIDQCVSLVEHQALFHNVQITKHFSEDLPMVYVDPSQMQQVFMNMIINAAEAIEDSGQLSLETKFDQTEDLVEIDITDTGEGIPEENLDKLFDPFFTTKEVGKGTGLGLAISYGIIKEHEGTISVESELKKGTTFHIKLPRNSIPEVSDGRREVQSTDH